MFGLTERFESLETKLDSGFQRIEQKLEGFEKHLDERMNSIEVILAQKIDLVANRIDQKIDSKCDSLKVLIEQGFANLRKELRLEDRLANLEADVARLKANARS